jgi:hypothetical protein
MKPVTSVTSSSAQAPQSLPPVPSTTKASQMNLAEAVVPPVHVDIAEFVDDPPRVGRVALVASMPPEVYARASEQAYQRDLARQGDAAAKLRAKLFVDAAHEAQARGDVVAAAQNYKLGLQIHEDEEVRRSLKAIDEQARTLSYEAAVKHAIADEREGRWSAAVGRYAAAYSIRSEAAMAERLAHALLKQGTDIRRAIGLAETAVLEQSTNVEFRLTLAEACLAAGLKARAAGEASRALALSPDHAGAKELVARIEESSR